MSVEEVEKIIKELSHKKPGLGGSEGESYKPSDQSPHTVHTISEEMNKNVQVKFSKKV